MKLFLLFLFITVIIFNRCKEKGIIPLELATNIVNEYELKSSLSYKINYQIKYFSSKDDTIKISAKIDLIKVAEDSIMGGYIWINTDSIERYYDTKYFYIIYHSYKKITRFKPEQSYIISGNTIGEAIRIYFLNSQRLINGVTDSTNSITLVDEMIDNQLLWKLSFKFADDEYINNSWKNIWVNKENFTIPKINYSADMQGENQYNQWDIYNQSFNTISINDLKQRFELLKNKYEITDYKERSKEDTAPLANGIIMPKIGGYIYPDSTKFSSEQLKGNLTLIDFWYMDCFPCIQAIPHLNELYNKYKSQGLNVVGINPYNNTKKDLKRFPNFLKRNKIDYPIVFIQRYDTKEFKVFAYPTFYMIDKKGKVIYSGLGFGEEMVKEIDSLIKVNL